MKGKKITVLVIKLFAICAIAALILAFVNSKTAPIVAERQQAEFLEAFGEVYSTGEEFVPLEESDLITDVITDIIEVSESGKQVGYVIGATTKGGYGGDISFIIGIQNDGEVMGFKVLKHSETTGFGAVIDDDEYVNSVIGKLFNQGIVATSSHEGDNEVEAISGATFTTNAMVNGFNEVVETMSKLSDEIGDVDITDIEQPVEEVVQPSKDDLLGLVEGGESVLLIDEDSIKNDIVKNAYEITSGDKKAIAIQVTPKGFAGNINYTIAILDGNVTGMTITETNETIGFGDEITSDDYQNSVIGISVDDLSKVDAISGATFTSNGMEEGYGAIIEAYKALISMEYKTTEFVETSTDENDSSKNDTTSSATGEVSSNEVDVLTLVPNATQSTQTDNVYELSDGSNVVGIAVEAIGKGGFGGDITFYVGIDLDGNITGYEIAEQGETVGFGAVIEDDDYKDNIIGKNISDLSNVDAISGATFTTNAMQDGFNQVVEAYNAYLGQ